MEVGQRSRRGVDKPAAYSSRWAGGGFELGDRGLVVVVVVDAGGSRAGVNRIVELVLHALDALLEFGEAFAQRAGYLRQPAAEEQQRHRTNDQQFAMPDAKHL